MLDDYIFDNYKRRTNMARRKPQGQDEQSIVHLLDDEGYPSCGYEGSITVIPPDIATMKINCSVCKWRCACGSRNFIRIEARCKDMCRVVLNNNAEMEGYAPGSELGLDDASGDDYVIITYCAYCGQILNDNFPVDEKMFDAEVSDLQLKPKNDAKWLRKKAADIIQKE
jgi:hypothetical protein